MLGIRRPSRDLDAINAGSSYHTEWQRLGGVAEGSAVCHDHRLLMEVIRAAACVDQLDLKGLCFAEHIVRRAIQLETAVERTLRHPDFSGLAVVEGGVATGRGNVRVPKIWEHIASRQKDRVAVLKHERLYREEQERERKGWRVGDDDGYYAPPPSGSSSMHGRGRGCAGRGKKQKGDGSGGAAAAHEG